MKSAKMRERKVKIDKRKVENKVSSQTENLDGLLALHDKLIMREETKEPIPQYKGADYPVALLSGARKWRTVATETSNSLLTVMRGMFGDQPYRVSLKTAFTMSSSGGGVVNSALFNSGIASLSQFTALASVFDEFYIWKVRVFWQPASRYNGPIGFVATTYTTAANVPLGVAKLQHSQAAYATLGAMANNAGFEYVSTGDPFSCTWVNADPGTSTVVAMSGQTNPFQGWGPCANVSALAGGLQFLSNTTPALPVSAVLGSFVTAYDVSFRLRL